MLMDTVVISSNSEGASKAMIALACDGSQVQQPLIRLAGHRRLARWCLGFPARVWAFAGVGPATTTEPGGSSSARVSDIRLPTLRHVICGSLPFVFLVAT